jgi:hypothetical protein
VCSYTCASELKDVYDSASAAGVWTVTVHLLQSLRMYVTIQMLLSSCSHNCCLIGCYRFTVFT